MPGVTMETRTVFWIIAAIAGSLFAILGNDLGKYIVYRLFGRKDKPSPPRRSTSAWALFILSFIVSIVFGVIAAFAPASQDDVVNVPVAEQNATPTSEKLSTIQSDASKDTTSVVSDNSSTSEPTFEISSKDSMELLPVPEGIFTMGNDSGPSDEKPSHSVYLDKFWIDKTEVTIEMFSRFVSETGFQTSAEINDYGNTWVDNVWQEVPHANWMDSDGDGLSNSTKMPVTQVSWWDAQSYCAWAGRRLPTEAEWEKAARGIDGRIFPWGDSTPDSSLLSFNKESGISIVGSYPNGASPYGALDMSGNVWEWTADWYGAYYYVSAPQENPKGPTSAKDRVLRGGAWDSGLKNIRITNRDASEPQEYNDVLGFRCAK